MKNIILFFILLIMNSCYKGIKVDLLVHNGRIHTMNEKNEILEAIAIEGGKIIEVGPERQIMNKYRATTVVDAKSKDIYPGFHDAHGHIIILAKQMLNADLLYSRSYYEMLSKLEKHHAKSKQKIIIGRGWDQSLWGDKNLPNDSLLNEVFPNIPVALTRIDGHAMLINQAMRDYIGITDTTFIQGGEIVKNDNKITGIVLDNAVSWINSKLPKPDKEAVKQEILKIQDQLLTYGITTVHEAGLSAEDRDIFIELANENKLKINVYAMLFPSPENIKFAEKEGIYKNNRLTIRSFKIIIDGALGSYGARLIEPYSDRPETHGLLLETTSSLQKTAILSKELGYQLNVHCIVDYANRIFLKLADSILKDQVDHRWRIEHAQVVHPDDFQLFASSGVIPSVQPTHATTDKRWAEQRLGIKRLQERAYAYKSLQKESGMILFGTDFPIEDFNPFATIFAATQRKSTDNEPIGGFIKDEALPFNVSLKAMTIWASFGAFDESETGTIEQWKKATFTIFDQPVQNTTTYLPNYAWLTVVDGNIVFDMR